MKARFPALATPAARIFYAGQFLSLIGTWMQNTVQPYLAYRISGNPFDLGLIGFAGTLPALLFTLIGGVFIERIDRRKTVIVLQGVMMVQAFVLAALALTQSITIQHIIILAFVLGTANAIEITARQAWLIELVGRPALPNAIALQASIFNTARVIGPALAAPFLLLVNNGGEGWAFLANGISYCFVIAGLLHIHPNVQAQTQASVTQPANPKTSMLNQFRDGQQFIRQTPLVAALIVMAAMAGMFAFPVIQQLPVFARDVLRTAADTDAAVAARNSAMATVQGFGALAAALGLAFFSGMKRKGFLLTLGQLALCVALLGLAFLPSFTLALPIMALFGWGTVTALASTNTIIQLNTPDELRGRVISTYLWALQGIAPFGSLLIGYISQHFGATTSALVAGITCTVVLAGINWRTSVVRRFVS